MGNRGINVPIDANCVYQWYKNSTVTEAYEVEEYRNTRFVYLESLGRKPIRFLNNANDLYMVEWTEPRGTERPAHEL